MTSLNTATGRLVGPLEVALRSFHGRNWREDIGQLNKQLCRPGAPDAGLQLSPPSIITGDPFELKSGACILVLGINPGWPRKHTRQRVDCFPAQRAWELGFDAYREHRRGYFACTAGHAGKTRNADVRYNGHHFSRLGNAIAGGLGVARPGWDVGPTARWLFRERAAIFDLLPYWSTDTQNMDLSRMDADSQSCVAAWKQVIDAFIEEKAPVAIIVNSSGQRMLVEKMLSCETAPILSTGFSGGRCLSLGDGIPVLAHPFLGSWRGLTRDEYVDRFQQAAPRVGLDLQNW
jgi:hypothetical protein